MPNHATTSKNLPADKRGAALEVLSAFNAVDYKKSANAKRVQTIFTLVDSVFDKSEKLHTIAAKYFNKDKSYAPKTLSSMASGEKDPSAWLTACAIILLLTEDSKALRANISDNDIYEMLASAFASSGNPGKAKEICKSHSIDLPSYL